MNVRPTAPTPELRPPAHGWIPKAAKIILPIVAIGVVALVFFWSRVNLQFIRLQLSETEVAPEDIETISMVNARFAGKDSHNRRFLVTADVATQAIDDENIIDLQGINADVVLTNGATIKIDAERGELQRDTKMLSLSGIVNLHHDRGYLLHTTAAVIDLQNKTASGNAPVSGTGPDGALQAEGFRVAEDGNQIDLVGRSKLTVTGAEENAAP